MFEKLLNKIPENVLVGGAIIGLFAAPIIISYFANTFEGLASIILLVLGIVFVWKYGKTYFPFKWTLIFPLIGFIFIGVLFDGAGNFIYNKPINFLFCPENTTLTRNITTVEDQDGNDVAVHNFSCFSIDQGQNIKAIPRYYSMGIRFIEYFLIGLMLFGINFVVLKLLKLTKKKDSDLKK